MWCRLAATSSWRGCGPPLSQRCPSLLPPAPTRRRPNNHPRRHSLSKEELAVCVGDSEDGEVDVLGGNEAHAHAPRLLRQAGRGQGRKGGCRRVKGLYRRGCVGWRPVAPRSSGQPARAAGRSFPVQAEAPAPPRITLTRSAASKTFLASAEKGRSLGGSRRALLRWDASTTSRAWSTCGGEGRGGQGEGEGWRSGFGAVSRAGLRVAAERREWSRPAAAAAALTVTPDARKPVLLGSSAIRPSTMCSVPTCGGGAGRTRVSGGFHQGGEGHSSLG